MPAHPHLLILNHTSFMDAVALMALLPAKPGYRFTARQQYRRQFVFFPLLQSIGTVILKRPDQHHRMANVDLLVQSLQQQHSLVIFPEGGFNPESGLHPFHSGAFVAACRANAPVAVGAIKGAAEVLRPGTWWPRRHPVKVLIGPAFYPGAAIGTTGTAAETLMNNAHFAIEQLQEKLSNPASSSE